MSPPHPPPPPLHIPMPCCRSGSCHSAELPADCSGCSDSQVHCTAADHRDAAAPGHAHCRRTCNPGAQQLRDTCGSGKALSRSSTAVPAPITLTTRCSGRSSCRKTQQQCAAGPVLYDCPSSEQTGSPRSTAVPQHHGQQLCGIPQESIC